MIVPVRLPAALERIRLAEESVARLGVPAHVTLLFPFVPWRAADRQVLDLVEETIAVVPAFDVTFREVRRWEPSDGAPEGVVWLGPEPAAPFIELIERLRGAFPAYPPYGGLHDEVIPHLTLASDDRRKHDAVEREARSALPFRRRVAAATLIAEGRDGRWRTARRFVLGRG